MSCGAPVAASCTSSIPELLGDLRGTFDPHDREAITACLASILGSAELLDELRERSRQRAGLHTWKRVAERSLEGYDRALAAVRRRRGRRSRLALVPPWPPERSGVSTYSERLADALSRTVDVDVIVSGDASSRRAPRAERVR